MHEPLLARAALPAPGRICGIPLRPYSLGHELYLYREASPFVTGGKVLPGGDIFTAIWICSSTWTELERAPSSWLYLLRLWAVKRRVRRADPKLAEAALREYLEDGSLELKLSTITDPTKKKARQPGTPFLLRLHDFVCHRYRLTLAQGWDFPVGEVKCRWSAYWEMEGGLEVYNAFDAATDEDDEDAGAVKPAAKPAAAAAAPPRPPSPPPTTTKGGGPCPA